ncbi:MAG: hypothetical protein P4M02_00155 [Clostridia bacterium]|nr:hypothetical protein [Clostridia bacterium]
MGFQWGLNENISLFSEIFWLHRAIQQTRPQKGLDRTVSMAASQGKRFPAMPEMQKYIASSARQGDLARNMPRLRS